MPGHVKKTSGPDEDPCPYLVVTLDMKREHAMKPYDPKKSYWCPDGKGNYMECMLDEDDGTKAKVSCGHEVQFLNTILKQNYEFSLNKKLSMYVTLINLHCFIFLL